jgi:hypothetical protein
MSTQGKGEGYPLGIDEFIAEHPWKDDKVKQHIYNHVLDGSATQEDVFEDSRASLIDGTFNNN